jgi:hypothetical protein
MPKGPSGQLLGKPHLELQRVISWLVSVQITAIIRTSRNNIWNADVSSNEHDYTSIDLEVVYQIIQREKYQRTKPMHLDQWRPIYPTELHEYAKYGANFQ